MSRIPRKYILLFTAILLLGRSFSYANPNCGDTMVSNTTLTSNMNCPSGTAITIGSSGVILDLNGYSIIGNSSNFTLQANNLNNFTIISSHEGGYIEWRDGISLSNVNSGYIKDVTIHATSAGSYGCIVSNNVSGLTLDNVIATGGWAGFLVTGWPTDNLTIMNSTFKNNGYHGFWVYQGTTSNIIFFHNNVYGNSINFLADTWYTLSWNFRWHTSLTGPCFYEYNNWSWFTPYDSNRSDIIDTNCYYDANAWDMTWRSYGLISLLMDLWWLDNIPWLEDALWPKFNAKNAMNVLPILVGKTYNLILGFRNTLWRPTSNDKLDSDFHFKVSIPDGIGTGNTWKIEMKVKFFMAP